MSRLYQGKPTFLKFINLFLNGLITNFRCVKYVHKITKKWLSFWESIVTF